MKHVKRLLIAAAVAFAATATGAAWAESAVPDPGNFFSTTPEFDPNAAGTKYSGSLTISYVYADDPDGCPDSARRVDNMYLVMTLSQGNNIKPFNTDFVASGAPSFCFLGEADQVQYVLGFIRNTVIPGFYGNCLPGSCPDFKVKSISNLLTTGVGAVRMDITIAVQ